MHKIRSVIAAGGMAIVIATLASVPGRAQSPGIEQQLRSQYRVASVGANGVVVRAGSMVIVQRDGITALPAPGEYPCNVYKRGGRIGHSAMCAINYAISKEKQRLLQVGERAYLIGIQFKPNEVVFKVQTCPADANEAAFRADIAFQFSKGYQTSMSANQVLDTIAEIFGNDTGAPAPQPPAPQSRAPLPYAPPPLRPADPRPAVPALQLPAAYTSVQNPADQLQLNADNSFSLLEGGQTYNGVFAVNGDSLELTIGGTNTKTTAKIQGNNLTDGNGQTWTLREQPVQAAAEDGVLQNQDIIKMLKSGFPETVIIAKISVSPCKFDTSPDTLIQLKESGVSPALMKAMVAK